MGNLVGGNRRFGRVVAGLPSMAGKVVAVTGCTSGTGKIFAQVCAKKGAKVVLLNRESARAAEAFKDISEVAKAAGAPAPSAIPCDLTSFKSVHAAGERLQAELRESGIDVLCNNAGIMGFGDKATEDGCDIQMQTPFVPLPPDVPLHALA